MNPAPLLGIANAVGVYREAEKLPSSSTLYAVGSSVFFTGHKQYAYASSEKAVEASPCTGKITAIYEKGRHPYHVVGSGVYGWVNKSDVSATAPVLAKVKVPVLNIRAGAGMNYHYGTDSGHGDLSSVLRLERMGQAQKRGVDFPCVLRNLLPRVSSRS